MRKTLKITFWLCLMAIVLLTVVSCDLSSLNTAELSGTLETTPEATTPEATTPEGTTPEETTGEVTTPEHVHAFGDWDTVTEPKCFEEGLQQRSCGECGCTEEKSIDAIGSHKITSWVRTNAPTCTATGTEKGTCTKCGQVEFATVDPLGHNWENWEQIKAPSCTQEGEQQKTCARCGDHQTETLAKTHSYNINYKTNEQRFNKTWGICTLCNYVDQNHEHKISDGKCIYCDYKFVSYEVESIYDADGNGAKDVYLFAAALPEKFNNAIRIDAYKDLQNPNPWFNYDSDDIPSPVPYVDVYFSAGAKQSFKYTVTVEEAGTYEMAIHLKAKDYKVRAGQFVVNGGTANEYKVEASYGWATNDDATAVRNNDKLQGTYMYGITLELQAGENVIEIFPADDNYGAQYYRDFYLVKTSK